MATSDHRPKLRMKRAGSSCAAKNEHEAVAIIGAEAPSGQPVPIQKAQQIRIADAAPAADHRARPRSVGRTGAAAASEWKSRSRDETIGFSAIDSVRARQSRER